MADVLVVGCGLIGTSIGLALQGSSVLGDVVLVDKDRDRAAEAVNRGAGRAWDGQEAVRLVVAAVPPSAIPSALTELQRSTVGSTFTHVSSVQSHVQAEVEALCPVPSRVVGGHPLAGRELSGPGAAVADLFSGRPWAVCPRPDSAPDAVAAVVELARECGAAPLEVSAEAHDRAVAVSSHVPHLVSSLLAGLLVTGEDEPADLRLAGPGLADTTRLAAGDASLWVDILSANAAHVAGPARTLGERLLGLADLLAALAQGGASERQARARLREALVQGNRGRQRVPLKRGELAEAFVGLRVAVADEPGQLAALLTSAGAAGINVEDVRVEHVPGRPRGVIELLVARASLTFLRTALEGDGWHVI